MRIYKVKIELHGKEVIENWDSCYVLAENFTHLVSKAKKVLKKNEEISDVELIATKSIRV